ncbi:type II toxin-antitoxin system Phd/YefM family antitoxin [Macrococcus animalis]|uniref:type II toxin-antitoxin system Phd/YefM family antitoxin n=1 Tax=Macrococcus animalis TaxID=3395467 RepID=UPI0039BDC9F4
MKSYSIEHAKKHLESLIHLVNDHNESILIKDVSPGNSSAVLIGEDQWNSMLETLETSFKIEQRKKEEEFDFDSTWDNLL